MANRNIGSITSWISWKSCQLRRNVTTHSPIEAKVKPMSSAPGTTSSAIGVRTRPSTPTTARNAVRDQRAAQQRPAHLAEGHVRTDMGVVRIDS